MLLYQSQYYVGEVYNDLAPDLISLPSDDSDATDVEDIQHVTCTEELTTLTLCKLVLVNLMVNITALTLITCVPFRRGHAVLL